MQNFSDTGRIGRDAEVRHTPGGIAVANFPVAIDSGYGQNKKTVWLECALFGKRAEGSLIQHLTKGTQVHVVGEIGQREFQKQDGTPAFRITLNVSDLRLIGGQQSNQQTGYQQQQPQQNQARQQYQQPNGSSTPNSFDDFDDEIPF
ncbi:Single-stranded DNA-binding protein [Halomonadaceae bacterium LMG 33818]|uniref:single-stranded DNA-binding protein n=1 Tax=Cernens ardua TaxID=3402176 RepID=UPI003EDBE3C1